MKDAETNTPAKASHGAQVSLEKQSPTKTEPTPPEKARLLELDPSAQIARIQKDIAAGHLQDARAALNVLPSDSVPAHLLALVRASLAKAEGDTLTWLTLSATAYAADSTRPSCYGNYAIALQALGQSDLANKVMQIALDAAPHSARPLYWQSRVLEQQKNLKGALKTITKAIGYAPEDHKIRRYRLQLLIKTGQHQEALEDLEILQKDVPQDKTLCRWGVEIAKGLGDPEMEMTQSKQLVALSRSAEDLRAHIDRLFATGDPSKVLPFLKEAALPSMHATPVLAETAERLERSGQDDRVARDGGEGRSVVAVKLQAGLQVTERMVRSLQG